MAIAFPLTVGFKYAINSDINVFAELGYRFTNTDYLDDVSTNYADPTLFPTLPDGSPSPEYLLQTEVMRPALVLAKKVVSVEIVCRKMLM
jgi:hypothetical protein